MASTITVGTLRALLTLDSAKFESGMREAAGSAKQFESQMRKIGSNLSTLGKDLSAAVTLPLVTAFGASAKAAIDFESSFAGVRKTVDASEPEFRALAQQFRNLAKEIPVSVNVLNQLGESAGALGIPKQDIVEFTKVMAELGVTTNVTAEQAANDIAGIQNIFGAAGKDTARFASTLVDLGNKGASTEQEILALATRIASAGHTAHLTQDQVLGWSAAIANVKMDAEAGGSAMSRVFKEIGSAVSAGGVSLQKFAMVAGSSSQQFAQQFRENASGATQAFITGLARIQEGGGDLNTVIDGLGFTELRQSDLLRRLAGDSRGLASALATASTAWQQNTALTAEAQKRFETTSSKVTLLWNRITDVGITIGNAFLPMIRSVIAAFDSWMPVVERVANEFAALPTWMQGTTIAIAGIAAAAGPVLWLFGQLAFAAASLAGVGGLSGLATSVTTLTIGTGGLAVALKGLALTMGSLAIAITAVWAAWQIGNTESVKDRIAVWALSADNLTAVAFRAAFGVEKLSEADARAAVKATAAAEAEAARIGATKRSKNETDGLTTELNRQISASVNAIQKALDHAAAQEKLGAATRRAADELKRQSLADVQGGADVLADRVDANEAYYATALQLTLRGMQDEQHVFEDRLDNAARFTATREAQDEEYEHFQVWVRERQMEDEGRVIQHAEALRKEAFDRARARYQALVGGISDGFARMLVGARGFKDGFVDIFHSIQQSFARILAEMLDTFLTKFLGGLITGIAGAKLAEKLGLSLAGGGGGSGWGGGGGGGGRVGDVANGVGWAQKIGRWFGIGSGGGAGATSIVAPGIPAVAGTGDILAGTGAGAGTGTGIGAQIMPFLSNPWTWAIAGGLLLGWGITKKGWFRGGEEGVQVNPKRDKFILQFGPPGTDDTSGFGKLAATLASWKKTALFTALTKADTMKKFQSAETGIISAFSAHGIKNIKKYKFGGFVPSGRVQAAILHGPEYVVPAAQMAKLQFDAGHSDGGQVLTNVHYNFSIYTPDTQTMDRHFEREIIPRIRKEMTFNSRGLATDVGRGVRRYGGGPVGGRVSPVKP